MGSRLHNSALVEAVVAMEGMEDREVTFLEGLEDQGTATLAMAVAVMDRTEAAMAAMDMVLVALEVVVEAEARQAPHLLVAGRPMRTGMAGKTTACTARAQSVPWSPSSASSSLPK